MSDEPDSLMLPLLWALRTDLSTVKTDTAAIRRQLTSLGPEIARLRQDAASDNMNRSHAEERVDALEDRLARIEGQIGITDL